MSSREEHSYGIMQELDVDYVLILFGGLTGYASDDINKFLWMVRIGGSTPEGAHIKVILFFSLMSDSNLYDYLFYWSCIGIGNRLFHCWWRVSSRLCWCPCSPELSHV